LLPNNIACTAFVKKKKKLVPLYFAGENNLNYFGIKIVNTKNNKSSFINTMNFTNINIQNLENKYRIKCIFWETNTKIVCYKFCKIYIDLLVVAQFLTESITNQIFKTLIQGIEN
jgi:hypothetical protein